MKKGQIFNQVAITKPKRNKFDLSHDRKFSAQMGKCYPILCEEVYPNEDWNIDGQSLVRTAPMVAPMMHVVNISKHYFYVPNRILWKNWDLFITGGDKFNDGAPVPVPPYVIVPPTGFAVGSIPDHLGFPTGQGAGTKVSAFPFAAYLRCHQEYYRDENMMETTLMMLDDGDNTSLVQGYGLYGKPMMRCWERDYFTSALPEPQKGPEVTIPLGDIAPINYRYNDLGRTVVRSSTTDLPIVGAGDTLDIGSGSSGHISVANDPSNIDISSTHEVDLSAATSATVNSWRLAMSVQRLYERLARGGSRTIEFLRAVWNSKASSSRLDRPEYIGGALEPLSVSEVLQTSESDGTPQGNMSGHGVAVARINSSHYHSDEYGVLIGIFSVMPKTAYQQGVRKAWLRLTDRFDYYFPDLAHIGEQPVLNAEIYLQDYSGDPDTDQNVKTFGYLPYGTELRYINDSVHGEFRTTQDHWHMGRIFDSLPLLNDEFLYAEPTRRVFADISADTDTLYCHIYHKIHATRCIPMFGTPM